MCFDEIFFSFPLILIHFLTNKVDIEAEKNDENLKKAFKISQTALKNVTRKNRENKIELQEFEKEIQRTTIKSKSYKGLKTYEWFKNDYIICI